MTPQHAGSDRNQSAICSHRHDEQRGLICKKKPKKNNASSPLRGSGSFRVSGGLRCLSPVVLVVLLRSGDWRPMARRPSLSVIVRSAPAVGGSRLFTRRITGCRCSAKRGGFALSHKNTSTRRRRKREGRHGSQGAQRELTSDPAANIASKGGREKKKKKSPPSNRQLLPQVCESPPKWSMDCNCAAISSGREAGGGVDPAERGLISRQRSEDGAQSCSAAVISRPPPVCPVLEEGAGERKGVVTLHLTSSNNGECAEKCHHYNCDGARRPESSRFRRRRSTGWRERHREGKERPPNTAGLSYDHLACGENEKDIDLNVKHEKHCAR